MHTSEEPAERKDTQSSPPRSQSGALTSLNGESAQQGLAPASLRRLQRAAGNRAVVQRLTAARRETTGLSLQRDTSGAGETSGSVAVPVSENVGSWNYGLTGAYTWRLTEDSIEVKVGINFVPESKANVPASAWFQYIKDIWNHSPQMQEVRSIQARDLPTCSSCGSSTRVPSRSMNNIFRHIPVGVRRTLDAIWARLSFRKTVACHVLMGSE